MPEVVTERIQSLPTVSPDIAELLEKNKQLEEELKAVRAENIELKADIAQKKASYVHASCSFFNRS